MKWALALALAAFGLAALIGGTAPFGRVLLALGAPRLAARVFTEPDWQAVALFRSGAHAQAARRFTEPFNRGNALVHDGQTAAALEAYDIALSRGDTDARANFDIVAAYFAGLGIDAETLALFPGRKEGPTAESFIAEGSGRAAGTGSEVTNTNTMLGLAQLDSSGESGVRRVFDDRFIVADDRWLRQLPDEPGAFLAARIAQEHKRRRALGLSPPDPGEDKP